MIEDSDLPGHLLCALKNNGSLIQAAGLLYTHIILSGFPG